MMCFLSASQMCKTFYFRVTCLKDKSRLPTTIFAFGNQKKWLGNEKGVKMFFNTLNTTWSTVKLNVFFNSIPR